MNRSFRTTVGYILLIALTGAGFSTGKGIGSRLRRHSNTSLSPWEPGSISDDRSSPSATPSEVFASVLEKVQQDYVGSPGSTPVSNARLTQGALGRMIASLQDPRTVYLDPSQTESRTSVLLGRRFGIGAELAVVSTKFTADHSYDSFLAVKSVSPGGPAERAGLRTGDRITELNDEWIIAYPVPSENGQRPVELAAIKHDDSQADSASQIKPGITAARAIQILTTGVGKSYRLTVGGNRRSASTQIDITTALTIVPGIEYSSPAKGITYLRIDRLNPNVTSKVDSVLSRRADWAVGLIVDLRQNSGGVEAQAGSQLDGFDCALDLIGRVAVKKEIGQIEYKPGFRKPINSSGLRPASNRGAKIAVLIDGGTSNIAEMAAAGMRDAGGATLIGSRTFGDDVLTRLNVLNGGGAVEMASAHLFTAHGTDLSAGLEPDTRINWPRSNQADPVFLRAMKYVAGR